MKTWQLVDVTSSCEVENRAERVYLFFCESVGIIIAICNTKPDVYRQARAKDISHHRDLGTFFSLIFLVNTHGIGP
jgi:hypothetical protein